MNSLPVESRATPAQTGVWVGIAAISMSFAAYTSALLVRQSATADWLHFKLPPILFFNTLVVLASSMTLYLARVRRAATSARSDGGTGINTSTAAPQLTALYITLLLGLLFLVGQLLAWRDLAEQGLTLATSPSSSFFFLLTALHGIHLLGGLAGLLYVVYHVRSDRARAQRAYAAATLYWHFMTVLWLNLFAVLAVRI